MTTFINASRTNDAAPRSLRSEPSAAPVTIREHRARLKTLGVVGGRLAYVDEGPRDGQAILLLHGMPSSSWLFRSVIPLLVNSGLRVIAPDLLGFGASDKPVDAEQYAFHKQADRIVALMQHLGIPGWTQVVHDLSGPWTWELIDRNPHYLQGLVVTNTSAYLDGFKPPAMVKMVGGPLGPIMTGMMGGRLMGPLMVGSFFKRFVAYPGRLDANVIEGYWLPLNEGTTHAFLAFARSFSWFLDQLDRYAAALRRLAVPATTIWGKRDPVLNWQKLPAQFARDLQIPPERMHAFDDAGHFLYEDKPAEVAALLVDFVRASAIQAQRGSDRAPR